MVESIRGALDSVVTELVKAISGNLASNSAPIRDASTECLDALCANLDAIALIQPFAQTAQYANIKVKGAMIPHVCTLVSQGSDRNQKAIIKHVIPFACSLLTEKKGGLQTLTTELFQALRDSLGNDLKQYTTQLNDQQKKALEQMMA